MPQLASYVHGCFCLLSLFLLLTHTVRDCRCVWKEERGARERVSEGNGGREGGREGDNREEVSDRAGEWKESYQCSNHHTNKVEKDKLYWTFASGQYYIQATVYT